MVAKTSESHPLRIDPVGIEALKGRIGLTFCPGKKQGISSSGPWDRELDAVLKAIQCFGATALVTLTVEIKKHETLILAGRNP